MTDDSGLVPVAERDQIDLTSLESWMRLNVDAFEGPLSYSKFAGGQSNPTYRLETPTRSYVLRRKPRGLLLPSAHAVDREFRVLSALARAQFPAPKPIALCEDDSVIGSMFYVMDHVEGRSIWDATLPGFSTEERRLHCEAMIDVLADLHNLDYASLGLADFGKPGNYFGRQIDRWTRQYRASETETIPAMDRLIEWLPGGVPPQTRTSIVHGDFRVDNLLFRNSEGEVAAVLDWELSTLGDPLADTSYFLMNWVMPPEGKWGVAGQCGPQTGIPTLEAMVDRYCARTSREGLPNLDWYFAYNMFRVACIAQGVRRRALDGIASSATPDSAATRVHRLASTACDLAFGGGA